MVGKKIKKTAKKQTRVSTLLKDVPQENYFYVCNGKVLKNLKELRDELMQMDEGTFRYHVNEAKNDFSNWINDILKNKKLADDLRRANSPQEILAIVETRIKKVIEV